MDIELLADDGLILQSAASRYLGDTRELSRMAGRGQLVQLRRGAYATRDEWASLDDRARHVLRIRAVVASAQRPPFVAGLSAAAIWGMPIAGSWPKDVTLLDEWLGGGRSEPGVRRTAAGFASARPELHDGVIVTSLARTALFIAARYELTRAIGSIDWALSERAPLKVDKSLLVSEINSLTSPHGKKRMARAVNFATELSGSFGESRARAVIHLLGFAQPELQAEFTDAEGNMYPDFFWRSVGIAGEFDGKAKYLRDEYNGGNPGETVWQEKRREDRLRRQVSGVVRILSSHVDDPPRLNRLLLEAGVPKVGGRK
jgi:hypothetical protein